MCVLVDTFHTLKSGVPTAIKVAKELGDSINFIGIRLDSGDIAYLSKKARRMLDDAGFKDAKIIASNDLDEQTITSLKAQGAKVDSWGIGTKLITGYDQPALGAVYKLVAVENNEGEYVDRIKLSIMRKKLLRLVRKKYIVLLILKLARLKVTISRLNMKILIKKTIKDVPSSSYL